MELIYELFGTDKDGFFNGLTEAFKKLYDFILPFILAAKLDEMLGTNQ